MWTYQSTPDNNYLCHFGVLGMKWGKRKGTSSSSSDSNSEEKKSNSNSNSKRNKRIAKALIATASVAAAAYYVHKNPDKIGKVISKIKNTKVSEVKKSALSKGKKYASEAFKSAKEGAKEALKEAPKKATKAVVTGTVLYGTKKVLDSTVGKKQSAIIFQANDNKKIGKFWKVSDDDKEDTD